MTKHASRITALLFVAAVTLTGAQKLPEVAKVSERAPVLTPAQALETFVMPPGYKVELVASEPLIQDPILIDWDTSGRMWAVELPGYMRDIRASGEYDPVGRVVVLEDTDRDGRMDKRTIFADGLIQPRALKVLDRGILVGEPPNIWLLSDTNGDGRADRRDLVTTGYGRQETNVEVNANALLWGLDNRIHVAGTGADLALHPENGRFTVQPSLSRGQWGATQDDAGRVYRNHNESVLHADLVPTPYYARNPNLVRTRGSHEPLVDPAGDVNALWPAHQTPGTNRAYQHGILRDNGTLAAFTAACAPTVYRGDRLPAELYGNVFVAEPTANVVSRLIVSDDGTTMRARKAYVQTEFLTSTDERFRPVYLSNAPDGTLYIVDIYRGIIQHHAYITEYLRDQINARKLEHPTALGRIYRVVHDTTRPDATRLAADATPMQLVGMLSHPNGWWRDTAQRLLVERSAREAVPALRGLTANSDWRVRLHALWTLDGLDAIDPAIVTKALEDGSRDVRASAIRLSERWLPMNGHAIHAAVLARIDDRDWAVRAQLAASLGALDAGARDAAIVSLLERHATDPVVTDAALSGLRGMEPAILGRLLSGGVERTPQREAAIAALSATIARGAREMDVQDVFASTGDPARPEWQRSALLRGAESALMGTPLPGGSPARGTAVNTAAPCPTCPGGRAGPGGAYAFPRPADWPAAGGRGRGPTLRLNREPQALSRLSTSPDALGARATALLARVTWPGKPGEAAELRPLTSEEQDRFDAGRDVYRSICQACHQPDGRGQEKLAPTLIGSRFALAAPAVPVRILLHGKEGAVGLMPPIGSTMDDRQLAGVLTYIRREWGQGSDPVDAETVARIRAETAGRARPWTDAELNAIAAAGRGGERQ